MEILLWLAGLGVLAENIFLFLQNQDPLSQETLQAADSRS